MSHNEAFPLPMPTAPSSNDGATTEGGTSTSVSTLRQVKKTYDDGEYDGEHNVSDERQGYGVMKYTEGYGDFKSCQGSCNCLTNLFVVTFIKVNGETTCNMVKGRLSTLIGTFR